MPDDDLDELAAHLVDDGTISASSSSGETGELVTPPDICDGCGVICDPSQCACGECLCDDCMEDHWTLGHMMREA